MKSFDVEINWTFGTLDRDNNDHNKVCNDFTRIVLACIKITMKATQQTTYYENSTHVLKIKFFCLIKRIDIIKQ